MASSARTMHKTMSTIDSDQVCFSLTPELHQPAQRFQSHEATAILLATWRRSLPLLQSSRASANQNSVIVHLQSASTVVDAVEQLANSLSAAIIAGAHAWLSRVVVCVSRAMELVELLCCAKTEQINEIEKITNIAVNKRDLPSSSQQREVWVIAWLSRQLHG
jgi:hypothetical protein